MANPSTMMHCAQALEHGAGIDRRALAEVFVARLDPDTGCFPSDLEQMAQERPFGVELRGGAQGHDLVLRLDHVHVEATVVVWSELALVQKPLHEVDGAQRGIYGTGPWRSPERCRSRQLGWALSRRQSSCVPIGGRWRLITEQRGH